jgi:uncharacterized protein (TIRG00374 family)
MPHAPRASWRSLLTGRRLLIGLTVTVAALALVTAFHDVPAVLDVLGNFDVRLLGPALALALVMHFLRFARWHLYARRVAGEALSGRDSLFIYSAGLGTHLTPGRAGEVVRFAFLRRAAGTPIPRSAPIIVAERLTDGAALVGLALPGALALGLGGRGAAPALLLPLLLLPLLSLHRTHAWLIAFARRLPWVRRFVAPLSDASAQLRVLLTTPLLLLATGLSLAATGLEVAVFTLVLHGLGAPLTGETYLRAAFVLPAAMLASAIFLVPGNLGVAEGGLAALARVTLALPSAAAAGAAILVRLCTIGLGLAMGAVALPLATRRWGQAGTVPEPERAMPSTSTPAG